MSNGKRGQDAVNLWAKMRAQHRTKLRVIGVIVVVAIVFFALKNYTGT